MSIAVRPARLWRDCVWLMLAVFGSTLWAQSADGSQIYTCVDAKGRKRSSDRPIMECMDREQTILNPSGTVKARLGPVLTAAERSQIEAARKAEQQEIARRKEEKSLNRSLLIRYPNQAAHQKEREEAVAQSSWSSRRQQRV
ncbi:DUF4124 domain-containing protein [Rhodoferax sp.]|uniref:DUF4124 domain-containing protein n=1 Tax=Rhodoferax sp. TaxID=50421 RepID=UPI0019EEC922|nr:DUF4124 domain-containing protein [Rhodoferax sp.]MBE0473955.1 DUF4124 domain-containing protein [Rhodoferax sp.]